VSDDVYQVPDDRRPRPAISTDDEAYAAVQRVVESLVPSVQQLVKNAFADVIFAQLVRPLLATAVEWRDRAVDRRDRHYELLGRWADIHKIVNDSTHSRTAPVSFLAAAYVADGDLPPYDSGIPFDTTKLTPAQIDELHQHHAHPDFEYATTEGPRKAWDDEMVPPRDEVTGKPGEGWEPDITSVDPEAWERFDNTEQRYWRRRKPSLQQGDDFS
jgi:Arc/MetJ family transcription regulator